MHHRRLRAFTRNVGACRFKRYCVANRSNHYESTSGCPSRQANRNRTGSAVGRSLLAQLMNKSLGSVWTPPSLNQLEDPGIDGRQRVAQWTPRHRRNATWRRQLPAQWDPSVLSSAKGKIELLHLWTESSGLPRKAVTVFPCSFMAYPNHQPRIKADVWEIEQRTHTKRVNQRRLGRRSPVHSSSAPFLKALP